MFSAEDAQIPSPPESVQDNRISNNVLRSRTLGYRRWLTLGCALLRRRLENVPRLVPDLHGKITTLCSQNVFRPAASRHAATCALTRTQKNTPPSPHLRIGPVCFCDCNRAPAPAGAFPIRPVDKHCAANSQRLSVYHITVRGLRCPSLHCQT